MVNNNELPKKLQSVKTMVYYIMIPLKMVLKNISDT